MIRTRWPFLVSILVISGLFGYLLRDVIYQTIIVPLAYLLWVLNFYYSALPQWLVWVIVLTLLSPAAIPMIDDRNVSVSPNRMKSTDTCSRTRRW